MWTSHRSVILSLVCTKIAILLTFALVISLPFLTVNGFFRGRDLIDEKYIPLMIAVTVLCCILSGSALFSLDRLLTNLRKGEVFIQKNVNLLRIISWACIFAAILLFVGGLASFVFIILGVAACFFGLVLRVVKNVFDAAVQIKTENDYTI